MQSDDEKSALLGDGAEEKSEPVDLSKGARPKIRNPKEAKRKRFVIKQAKTISKPQLLESVSETEESSSLLPKGKGPEVSGETESSNKGQEYFGVRSYVHTFYEAMAMDNQQSHEEITSHFGGYNAKIKKRRKSILCWRAAFCSGMLFLMMGLVAILVGFLVPKRNEIYDIQEDLEIISGVDRAFNHDLYICKIVGIILFCTGGCMVTGVLLGLLLTHTSRYDDPLSAEDIPLTGPDPDAGPGSAMDEKVPVTEELTAVQPKREDLDEVVMTNAGLCKIP